MVLTDLQIRKAKQKDKSYKAYDSLGLFLMINSNGSKLWRQKYTFMGKEKLLTHGAYPEVSLREAREKRDAIREELSEGKDPAVMKRLKQVEAETQAHTTFFLLAKWLDHRYFAVYAVVR